MKLLILSLAGLLALAGTACGESLTEIYLGSVVSGATTATAPDDVGGVSETYLIRVRGGVQHFVHLNAPEGNIVGLWDAKTNDFILQSNPMTYSRTVSYTFTGRIPQEVFVRSLDSDIPSPFEIKIWVP